VNVNQAQNLEANGGQTAGATIRHEIFESIAALSIVNSSTSITPTLTNQSVYNAAHSQAISMDPGFKLGSVGANQLYIQNDTSPKTLWMNLNPKADANKSGDKGWFKL
jgi:hypothetical protein